MFYTSVVSAFAVFLFLSFFLLPVSFYRIPSFSLIFHKSSLLPFSFPGPNIFPRLFCTFHFHLSTSYLLCCSSSHPHISYISSLIYHFPSSLFYFPSLPSCKCHPITSSSCATFFLRHLPLQVTGGYVDTAHHFVMRSSLLALHNG